ncbi:hypothetical protein SDJN03_27808, partial [Cucurbita argyrosperma subsp. sororia]
MPKLKHSLFNGFHTLHLSSFSHSSLYLVRQWLRLHGRDAPAHSPILALSIQFNHNLLTFRYCFRPIRSAFSLSLFFDSISCLSTYLPNASNRSRWGTKISTMLADRSLTVTSSRYFHEISLNRVMISSSPIYDDVRSLFLAPISFLT